LEKKQELVDQREKLPGVKIVLKKELQDEKQEMLTKQNELQCVMKENALKQIQDNNVEKIAKETGKKIELPGEQIVKELVKICETNNNKDVKTEKDLE
jgi:hypothetical protein